MTPKRIVCDPVGWMRLNDNGLLSFGPLGRPREGQPHRHVTIPLEPDRRGRARVHLTTQSPGQSRKHHEDVLDLSFEEWLDVWGRVEQASVLAFQAAVRRVSLEELCDCDYLLCDPPFEQVCARLQPYWALRGGTLRIRVDKDLIWALVEELLESATELAGLTPDDVRGHPRMIVRIDDDGEILDCKQLMYLHRPVGLGEEPGWFVITPDELSIDLMVGAMINGIGGRRFFEAMDAMAHHLGGTAPSERWLALKDAHGAT